MKVSGRVNNYTVSQTDRSSLGIYSNGNKAMLANIYSEDEQQHRQLLLINNRNSIGQPHRNVGLILFVENAFFHHWHIRDMIG